MKIYFLILVILTFGVHAGTPFSELPFTRDLAEDEILELEQEIPVQSALASGKIAQDSEASLNFMLFPGLNPRVENLCKS